MSVHPGILGIDLMNRHHVRNARATAGVDLVALAGPGDDRFGVADDLPALGGVEEIIEVGIDATIIAASTTHHEVTALALTEAGVRTLVEKPPVTSVKAGRRIHDAFAAAGLVSTVGCIGHCNPALIDIRRRIVEGQLGAIGRIAACRRSPFPARISDVSVVKDLVTYDVDLVTWMTGAPYKNIYARTSARSRRVYEDMVVASDVLAGGTPINHLANWLTPFKDRTTIVTGERGALAADTAMGDLTFYENDHAPLRWSAIVAFRGVSEGQVVCYALTKREPPAPEHEHFRDAILGAGNERVTMDKALDNLHVVEAIPSSAATGHSVDL